MSKIMRLPTQLLQRKIDGHKGDFGHILVLGGSRGLSGAPALCGWAAMRSGAGLVTLGIPEGINNALIKIKPQEVMTLPLPETKEGTLEITAYTKIKNFIKEIDVLAVGPGMTKNKSTQSLVRKILREINRSLVIDADGLNALVGQLNILRAMSDERRATILTPHPAEMSRLLGVGIKEAQKKREVVAEKFARDYQVTVILKGHRTVVADYTGRLYVNKTGNPGMATAGSGDVLSGIIAAFLGQGLDAFDAAKYAVYLHGLAGDLAAQEKTQIGLIASDIIERIPTAIKRCS